MAPFPHYPAAVEITGSIGALPALLIGLVLSFVLAYLAARVDDRLRGRITARATPAPRHLHAPQPLPSPFG